MTQYVKKVAVYEAIQWDGVTQDDIDNFIASRCYYWYVDDTVYIQVTNGVIQASATDWIVVDANNNFSVYSASDFDDAYEALL